MNPYIVAFNFIPQIGYKRLQKLLEHFGGNYENILKIPARTLSEIAGLKKPVEYNTSELLKKAEKEIKDCEALHIKMISVNDNEYPELLKEIPSPPLMLYCEGNIECLKKHCVAVVGTRNPTTRGYKNAKELARELTKYDITIVSGFAAGIDSAAHKSTIDAGGETCAVFGCGIDVTYPKENENLRKEIPENGCVVTEFPLGTSPARTNFPMRNRIIAGLSRACVMVEGTADSGALITANLAFDMNRSVFAYPGSIDNERYQGTNKLIKKNIASLITCHNDLIDELSHLLELKHKETNLKEKIRENPVNLSSLEKKIINLVDSFQLKHIDLLVEESGEAVNTVGQVLLALELKGLVIQKPGKLFIRS